MVIRMIRLSEDHDFGGPRYSKGYSSLKATIVRGPQWFECHDHRGLRLIKGKMIRGLFRELRLFQSYNDSRATMIAELMSLKSSGYSRAAVVLQVLWYLSAAANSSRVAILNFIQKLISKPNSKPGLTVTQRIYMLSRL